jgi:class 3 adenylate cyclase
MAQFRDFVSQIRPPKARIYLHGLRSLALGRNTSNVFVRQTGFARYGWIMNVLADLKASVEDIVTSGWDHTDGRVVPDTANLALGNHRVELAAVILYADLADSTELAITNQEIAAEVFKAYLRGATRLIRANRGEVRSFDGDRVMGVFIGERKNSRAAICGLQISYFFKNLLTPRFKTAYPAALANFTFAQTVGIDNGTLHVVRGGIRNNNDLVWVGRAPNIAAKLSAIRNGQHSTFVTESVYKEMATDAKDSNKGVAMWTRLSWRDGPKYGVPIIYGSNWNWTPPSS